MERSFSEFKCRHVGAEASTNSLFFLHSHLLIAQILSQPQSTKITSITVLIMATAAIVRRRLTSISCFKLNKMAYMRDIRAFPSWHTGSRRGFSVYSADMTSDDNTADMMEKVVTKEKLDIFSKLVGMDSR
ncbi:hypothetical protein O6P43_031191 [Quillaja saponaria]|uniref:Uncharacterized protein n=1 Tax=Quillaja saponaria TaxID=32244 RepID=A0AAD7P917_QUISA|nr:hypothetical protein O6P43_031191 [Quillaja saponaria]